MRRSDILTGRDWASGRCGDAGGELRDGGVPRVALPELIKTFACKLIALDPPETLGLP
jgi:hypothetical protein